MKYPTPRLFLFFLGVLITSVSAEPVHIATDRADGVYAVSETVEWTILRDLDVRAVTYSFKRGSQTLVEAGDLEFEGNQATLRSTLNEPGTLLLEVFWKDAGGEEKKAKGGVVHAPRHIEMSMEPPADFDAFWKEKLLELEAIPMNPRLEAVEMEREGVAYWKIWMDNIRGSTIHGQLARPKGEGPFPALFIVQWAGVYPLQPSWVLDRAAEGWLVLNIQAHDIAIGAEDSYYESLREGALKDYGAIGNDDRDTSYFLRMFLSCYRGAEYLSGHPLWNGETLAVMGGSQGGYQALITAAFHPDITAAMASVPAGCDLTGLVAGRQPGWPAYWWQWDGAKADHIREAVRYYDVGSWASRIHCPVLVGVGLLDQVCPPEGIFAAINGISAPVEVVIQPQGAHQNVKGSHEPYNQRLYQVWLPALLQGEPVGENFGKTRLGEGLNHR